MSKPAPSTPTAAEADAAPAAPAESSYHGNLMLPQVELGNKQSLLASVAEMQFGHMPNRTVGCGPGSTKQCNSYVLPCNTSLGSCPLPPSTMIPPNAGFPTSTPATR